MRNEYIYAAHNYLHITNINDVRTLMSFMFKS